MDRIGKSRGLIDYMALRDETAERAGAAPKSLIRHILRPRTILYFTLWSGIGVLLLVALLNRSSVDLNVSPVRNPLFVTLSDGAIRNTYQVRLRNKSHEMQNYAFAVDGPGAEALTLTVGGHKTAAVTVSADATLSLRLYLTAPAGSAISVVETTPLTLTAQNQAVAAKASVETVFHGKGD